MAYDYWDQPQGVTPRRGFHSATEASDFSMVMVSSNHRSAFYREHPIKCLGCGCFLNPYNPGPLCNPCRVSLFSFSFIEKGRKVSLEVFRLLAAVAEFNLGMAQEWLETYAEVSRMK